MNYFIPYLAIFIIFIVKLIAKVTTNSVLRGKLRLITIFSFLALCAYLLYFQIENIPYMSSAHMLTYVITLPEVISRIVNSNRIKSKSIQISTSNSSRTLGFIGMGIFCILTAVVIYFYFKEIVSQKSETLFDVKYFLIRLNFLLIFISGVTLMFQIATQKTIFYSEGILYDGGIWKWSDFDFYSWSRQAFESKSKELALATANHIRLPAQIKMQIPSEYKNQVDILLEQNLECL